MKTKILLSMAIVAILPFGAQAAYTYNYVDSIKRVVPSGTVNIARVSGPYQTAEVLPGDSTTAVSASYVKGAYNDTIAAINNLHGGKQQKFNNYDGDGNEIDPDLASADEFVQAMATDDLSDTMDRFVTAYGVATGIKSQRVTAVDTWGSTHTVDVGLKTAQ